MKLAVSNIAWAPQQHQAAYELLSFHEVRGLEIVPGLFLDGAGDVFAPTSAECAAALTPLWAAGLELVSMQSLLFGVEGAALFGSAESRRCFETGVMRAIVLAEQLGIPNLVFGSPRQRIIPHDMSPVTAEAIATETFGRLGDAAAGAGTILGIEFNPPAYGTNFLTNAVEAAAFVERLAHPAVRLILDVGAMHMNRDFDTLDALVNMQVGRISHVHLSEPSLAPSPADPEQAARVLRCMSNAGYRGWYSIEMKAQPDGGLEALGPALDRLQRAVKLSQTETVI